MSTEIKTETINLALLPKTTPSLCIPRVFKNITRERVISTINELNLGSVTRVDMVPSGAGDKFQRVFIHIDWNSSDVACRARMRLLTGKEIKIIYDEPWFWKVSANRATMTTTSAPVRNSGPSLVFDSDSDDADKPRPRPRQRQDQRPRPRHDQRPRPRHDQRPRPMQQDVLVDEFGRDIATRKQQEEMLTHHEEVMQERDQDQVQDQVQVQEWEQERTKFCGGGCSVLDVDQPREEVGLPIDYGIITLPVVKRKRIVKKTM